ncbi:hypothetical protein GCM10023224_30220 [Streptomonospora halophila]|uniref:Uncharacterized protein n=1 Tax=Streptomonospora halophila TaxID=427369 RepID=A0ABP9GIM7_9ACTN
MTGGVAHVDPAFSPYAPPAADGFDAVDAVDAVGAVGARMLARAEDRTDARERRPIGTPYEDLLPPALRVTDGAVLLPRVPRVRRRCPPPDAGGRRRRLPPRRGGLPLSGRLPAGRRRPTPPAAARRPRPRHRPRRARAC